MCLSPSLYFSCIPKGCKFISEEHQGEEKKLQQNPAMLGCIRLHNSKWPTFAFHAWRPETRAWIIQDKAGGGTKTQRDGHCSEAHRGHGEPDWSGHWKSRLTDQLANCLKRRNISSSHFQKAARDCPRKAPVGGSVSHTHTQKAASEVRLGFQVLERLTRRKGTFLPSPAELRLKDTAFPPDTRTMRPGLNLRVSDPEPGFHRGGLLPGRSSFPSGPPFARTRKLLPKGKKWQGTADRRAHF